MTELSPERLRFVEHLDTFVSELKPNSLVYDIGKSHIHDYRPLFSRHRYKTIDCDANKRPDYVLDIERPESAFKVPSADAIIVHGVYEQCSNPWALLKGASLLLKSKGKALFGLISVGFPLFDFDRQRITPSGVDNFLQGFNLKTKDIVYRDKIPSYVFVNAEKL